MNFTKEQEKLIGLVKESEFFWEKFSEIPDFPGSMVRPLFVYNFQLKLNLENENPKLIVDRGDQHEQIIFMIDAKGYLKLLSGPQKLDAQWIEILNQITTELLLKTKTYQKNTETKAESKTTVAEVKSPSSRLFSPSSLSSASPSSTTSSSSPQSTNSANSPSKK